MKIVALGSSGTVATVAVAEDDKIIAEYSMNYKKTHSETLLPMLDEIKRNASIELEDIEANLAAVPGVRCAAVAQRICDGKAESLTAFIIREGDVISDDYFGRKTVRMALKERMPSYMVPKRIVFLEALPVTNNGKLDRSRLREMA